jgi:hypothetical protein
VDGGGLGVVRDRFEVHLAAQPDDHGHVVAVLGLAGDSAGDARVGEHDARDRVDRRRADVADGGYREAVGDAGGTAVIRHRLARGRAVPRRRGRVVVARWRGGPIGARDQRGGEDSRHENWQPAPAASSEHKFSRNSR